MESEVERYSKWQEVLDTIVEHCEKSCVLKRIDSNHVISTCLKEQFITDSVIRYINDFKASIQKKCVKSCINKIKDGDKALKRGELENSLSVYNEALFLSPSGESYTEALKKRLKVFFQLKQYKACLSDIHEAFLQISKPCEIQLMEGLCYKHLNFPNKAMKVFAKCLSSATGNVKCKLQSEIFLLINAVEFEYSTDFNVVPKNDFNSIFPSASSCLEVKCTKEKGRHVVTREDIAVGDVLFVEQPFAFVVFGDVCHWCCMKEPASYPCLDCLDASYCSTECRQTAWDRFHKFECGYIPFLRSVGIAHLGLRLLIMAGSAKDLFSTNTSEGYPPEYKIVNGLQSHINLMTPEDVIQYAVTSLLLAQYLVTCTDYVTEEVQVSVIAGRVLHHITQLVSNAHAVTMLDVAVAADHGVAEEQQRRVATAIYPSASMMNHACDPTVINSFHGTTLVIRATKDVSQGEEIFNCYGPHYRRMATIERQEVLSGQYFFRCKCPPCLQPWDFLERFTALQCCHCHGALTLLQLETYEALEKARSENKLHPYLGRAPGDLDVMRCMDCGKHDVVKDDRSKRQYQVGVLLQQGAYKLNINDVEGALGKYIEAWTLGRQVLYVHNKDLVYAADQAAKCLAMMSDWKRSLMFLKCCIRSVEKRFGGFSVEMGGELQKLSDLQFSYLQQLYNKNDRKEYRKMIKWFMETLERAVTVYSSLYGPWHSTVKQLNDKKQAIPQI